MMQKRGVSYELPKNLLKLAIRELAPLVPVFLVAEEVLCPCP
jgi:hypothetical protein